MPDHILRIPLSDRAEVLQSIAPRAGLPPHILEKDVWVCWALAAVFEMPDRLPLAFKGGTSLSKVYRAIGRFSEPSYLRDRDSVLLEFGGRNTTLPNERHRVMPYAAAYTENLEFPVADVVVLSSHRSFWEKATLIHAECHRPETSSRGGAERISRHWYDLARLARQEINVAALENRDLLAHVIRLKGIFYRSGFSNYPACLEGKFRLIPDEALRVALERDFLAMVSEGMFFEPPGSFAAILEEIWAMATVSRIRISADRVRASFGQPYTFHQ